MRAYDLLTITKVCLNNPNWLPALLTYQKLIDERIEHNKKLDRLFLTDPYIDPTKSLEQLIEESEIWITG